MKNKTSFMLFLIIAGCLNLLGQANDSVANYDPCAFYRPPKSSASIYLNCLMYEELQAMVYPADRLRIT